MSDTAKLLEWLRTAADAGTLRCACGKGPVTCVGSYEMQDRADVGCDECCGHGNEDGWCIRLPEPAIRRKVCPGCGLVERARGEDCMGGMIVCGNKWHDEHAVVS